MRWTLILPALLAMACSAEANDRVIQATIFDEIAPSCAAQNCTGSGCAAKSSDCAAKSSCAAGCATAGATAGCAGACGQNTPACGCGTCEQSGTCLTCDTCNGGCDSCDNGKCKNGKCKNGKCKNGDCNNGDCGNGKYKSCNLPQHHRYPAVDHGYYYFLPYNYRHIAIHQDAVTRWGGDPRNPYSNEIFKAVYAEEAQISEQWDDVPVQMPNPPAAQPAPATGPAAEPPVPMPAVDETATTSRINQLRFISSQRGR